MMIDDLEILKESWIKIKAFITKNVGISYKELSSIDIYDFFLIYSNIPKKAKR